MPAPLLLLVLSLCGFSGALATRLLDPLLTSIASDFSVSVTMAALLSSAFALPFGLGQPFIGPIGDAFGKTLVIRSGVAILAVSLAISAFATDLTVLFACRILGGIAAGGIMPVCMALIGDVFPLAVRQLAMSRYIGATLIGQIIGASTGGLIAEEIGWRGVLACAAGLSLLAAATAMVLLPGSTRSSAAFNLETVLGRYRLILANPRSKVCFAIVFLEGTAIYGIMPFIGDMLRVNGAGGLREAGFVIGGLGAGGLLYALTAPLILRVAKRPAMMMAGGAIAAIGLVAAGLNAPWYFLAGAMLVVGFGFMLLHNCVQTEVTELAPSARASAFSLHAFCFFMGQALGPVVYGLALPLIGVGATLAGGATVLAATGLAASRLLAPARSGPA